MGEEPRPQLGCTLLAGGRAEFLVWAPRAERVELHIVDPAERKIPMRATGRGYYHVEADGVSPGTQYFFRLDGRDGRPDPASRLQPRGVHGPSAVVDPHFDWSDGAWRGLPLEEYLLYEIHVGAFTPEGTLDAVIDRLDQLKELGVTAVEMMPLAQFPGTRNWGYDGVHPFAVQASYGGPAALKRLVDACHGRGLAVALDVVYNHLGPEGNYLSEFGPYFTDRYRTPWGEAINFDGPWSDQVRRHFIDNALAWVTEFHIDALRLDAVHAIVDPSARPFLEELGECVHERAAALGRRIVVFAESDRNDARLVRERERGGIGLDALWNDDYHHAVHALLTGERAGYYADFGRVGDLARALERNFVYSGQYSVFRRRRHGNSARDLPPSRFVVFAQNHDQVGNRMLGERLATLVSFEEQKLAAGLVLLGPFLPLLFMGEEYGETSPFLYFVSHNDRELIEAVRRGRREEFAAFGWPGSPPDPQAETTFARSKIDWQLRTAPRHSTLWQFYRELIGARRRLGATAGANAEHPRRIAREEEKTLVILRDSGSDRALAVFHFGNRATEVTLPALAGAWSKELDSGEERWLGGGSAAPVRLAEGPEPRLTLAPKSFCLYRPAGAVTS